MFLNPEPLAPFADLIAVGEGESARAEDDGGARSAPGSRARRSTTLSEKDGFYVPSRYTVRYHEDGTVAAYDGPGAVVRQRGWPGQDGAAPVGDPDARTPRCR